MIVSELTQKRTPNTKTYLRLDGSLETHIYSGEIHYDDEDGNLYNINTDLHDEADLDLVEFPVSKEKAEDFKQKRDKVRGLKKKNSMNRDLLDYHGLQVPFSCRIPRNFKRGYEIGRGNNNLKFIPVSASPSKGQPCTNKPNAIEYQDPWNDVDVCLELTTTGIKETIILKTSLAPSKFSFEVLGDLAEDLTSGILKLEPAWLKDAKGEKRDVLQEVRRETSKTYIDLIADITDLAYPIEIDPTVTLGQSSQAVTKDTYLNEYSPTSVAGGSTQMLLGSSIFSGRTWPCLAFDLSSLPQCISVLSAKLSVSGFGTAGNTPMYFQNCGMYRFDADWNEATLCWNNKPAWTYLGQSNIPIGGDVTDSGQTYYFNNLNGYVEKYAGQANNPGFAFAMASSPSESNSIVLFTKENGTQNKLEVIYNVAPTAPTLTSPNGSEIWNAQHTITWNPSTDLEEAQNTLKYQIQLSTDDGNSWSDIVTLTSAGATSYTYDFSLKPESSLCKIRIRAYDGAGYGPWDESNGVFTINHNKAPLTPTNLSPSGGGYDRGQIIIFSWQHNDPNNSDPQSKFDLQWRVVGSSTWNTVTQTTINQYYDMPANTLPNNNIEWQVRTYDQQNLSGPYSPQITFTTGGKPASPTLTYPTSGAVIPIARPTVTWSSSGQTGYQLVVLNNLNAVVYDSGDITNTNKAKTIENDLTNGSSYSIKLRIKNSVEIWSDWVSSGVIVSYTPPAIPIAIVTPQNGYLDIAINNPTPSGSQSDVIYNDLYRRELGQLLWIRIKSGIANSGNYVDYAVASGVTYEYKIIANGSNGTVSESIIVQRSITLTWLWLHDVADPQGTFIQVPCNMNKSHNTKYEAKVRQFAGREGKSVEFSIAKEADFKVKLDLVKSQDWWEKLQQLADRRGTICARDARGRKIFGFIPGLPETDQIYGQEVDLEIITLDFSESVDPEEFLLPDGGYFNESTTKVIDGGEL